ncbi:MAG: cation transporter [bacterium]|nr:cation transporter [bacterium]
MIAEGKRAQENRQIRRITWIGLLANLLLSGLKFLVGFLGSSQAVIADAVHSLSDMFTDFAVIFGVKFWSAPPDEDHPYGHKRVEALVTTAIGFMLALVAFGLVRNALNSIQNIQFGQTGWVALAGPFISILVKEVLYRWTMAVGTQAKSSAVIANAWHHRSDALSSIPALLVVVASALNPDWGFVDHIGALIVSLFILKVSWDIISPALAELTDHGASKKEQNEIQQVALEVKGVETVHAIRTRKFGSQLHVDLHVLVDPGMSVRKGHNISTQVKTRLLLEGPNILDVVVHLEPNERHETEE